MPIQSKTDANKIRRAIAQHSSEFSQSPKNYLFCQKCCCVQHSKQFLIERCRIQRNTNVLSKPLHPSVHTFINPSAQNDFSSQVTHAFFSADIHKLKNKNLWTSMAHMLPNEYTY